MIMQIIFNILMLVVGFIILVNQKSQAKINHNFATKIMQLETDKYMKENGNHKG